MRKEYGHRHLGTIYTKLLTLDDCGFTYKNKEYTWNDVSHVKSYDTAWWALVLFTPSAFYISYIIMKDGTKIRLHGRALEEKGKKPQIDHLFGYSDAYKELVHSINYRLLSNKAL